MIYSIIYSPAAVETFIEISRQISERWGDKYVDEFKKRTIKVIETISVSPFFFRSIEVNPSVRKGLIHKNCSVFYEINVRSTPIYSLQTLG